jgi:prepilin-type N-terminal cleavage/methylation domain-containing protein
MQRRISARRGFTLLEVLISSSLAGVVMVAVLSSFLFIGRNLSRLASYQALESESRKALAYLRRDFSLAQAVRSGTTPTASTVSLMLPSGDVVYTYDTLTRRLRRQATFGASPDLYLLNNSQCECTSFTFSYYTTTDAAPTDQITPTNLVPFSIKQIQVGFVVESPSSWTSDRRTRYESISSRFLIRNRGAPDGT